MDIKQRRSLTDLYARGESVSLGEGEAALEVWVRKMTPTEAEKVYIRANSRRSSILAMAKEEEPSEIYTLLMDQVNEMGRSSLISWIASSDVTKQALAVEAKCGSKEEWQKEGYLEALQERFADPGFQETLKDVPDDPEVKRVISELERFRGEILEALTELEEERVQELDLDEEEELRTKVAEMVLDAQGDSAWMAEFTRCQIWQCTFWPDNHKEKVFPTRQDVDDIQAETIIILKEVLDRIHVPDLEGKD